MTGVGLIGQTGVRSFEDLRARCRVFAEHLRDNGFAPGDRVAIQGGNSIGYVIALLTLLHSDATLVLLEEDQSAEETAAILRRAPVRWLLHDGSVELPAEVAGFRLRLSELEREASPAPAGFELDLTKWWQRSHAVEVWPAGAKEAVIRAGGTVRFAVRRAQQRAGYKDTDVLLPLLPFSHPYGLVLLLLWWFSRSSAVVLPADRLDLAVEAITRMNVTVVDGTPAASQGLCRLLELRPVRAATLRSVRRWCVEGVPLRERPGRNSATPITSLNRDGKDDMRALPAHAVNSTGSVRSLAKPEPTSAAVPLPSRVAALRAVETFLDERRDEVLAILCEVSNHRTAVGELETAIRTLRGAEAEVTAHQPRLIGSAAVFMPSNIPLYAYVLYVLVPSLYCERVTFRPSAHIQSQLTRLHELLAKVHGLPVTLAASTQRQFTTGPVAGAELVLFTGTYANAERIRGQISEQQLFLYFGQGINPVVVGPDADVDLAVADAVDIRLINSGQDCFGPDVMFVHSSVRERFLDLLGKRIDELVFGSYDDPRADYGCMYYDQAFGFALEYLHRNSGHIVHGGQVELRARRLQPTVLCRELTRRSSYEELFAPIFNVVSYDDLDALHETLTTPFFEERAMGAMVYGNLPSTVELLARRHDVYQNTTLLSTDNGNEPFGGLGMLANYVAIGGRRIAEPLLVSKAVADHLKPPAGLARRATA
ncbi:aldehyde dehydrogenase family protein [Crossiella cryophila]|uniref:Acyl-CoA reductase-like NAD-dependent aldehyde dehydrogenase n=1 Tax=Crossiella cryophila TaxID=43355 RepID=A0A7W7C7V9_9PSEU|nr:aldehyde dehydrogenase family protein [Crossiella cryophila]MBB4676106.1 acyl-CoA reductase-like NAD-dependent aldehyde dehydrogenase [Crossiella cryophila]